ncbi:ComF family protein [uncultured Thiodictyon sp.]|uniref:ComF family protein n=1 Tax=uncultured Thiodictyon sp. TaxID=1846217 RepID=UPI0025E0F667|nr:ComF family protein [uncultured Thiodictyon sp.]
MCLFGQAGHAASASGADGGWLIGRLFPPTCLLCGAPGAHGRDLCAGCAAELPHNRLACPLCALPFDMALPAGSVCGACQRRPPPFARALAALRYETPIPTLVGAAKFRGRLNHARLLGQLLADAARALPAPWPQVLVPVPLHPTRLVGRGYNQSLEIARVVGRALDLPVDGTCCRRVLATPPQAGLDEPARRRNIRGAFAALAPLPWQQVAILDDVVTTGSTVSELTRVLRRAGARRVEVWAVARTP